MTLLDAQRALRSRFDEFRIALRRENMTAAEVALADFEKHFRRWTEAEEQALIPALLRANIAGRDIRRELRLEYVQIRELTRFISDQLRLIDVTGYVENLERRLAAHEREMEKVYYPAAALTDAEEKILEAAKPPD